MLVDLIQVEKDIMSYICNLKNRTKLSITQQKQTRRYKEQVSGYQLGDRKWEGQNKCREFRDASYYV